MAYKRISPQPVSEGGTGHTTLTTHNILIGNGTGALGVVAPASVQGIPVVSVNATSNPVFNTASVPGGGTGMTSATVVAPICGGNTTTSAFQSAASGISNAGYVLTSTGSATLPTWQASLNGIVTLDADTGSATGSTVDIAGGTGISTTATTGTLTVNLQVPIDVADGGTGETSLTAYAPICGGTTTTGALQSASTGISTSGFVLTSNGASAVPSFQAIPSASITLDGNTGSATGSTLTIAGGTGITTSATGTTVTITATGGGGGGEAVLLQTLTASTSSTLTFDDTVLTSLYDMYRVRFDNLRFSGTAQPLQFLFSADNGSTYLSSYDGGITYTASSTWSFAANSTAARCADDSSFISGYIDFYALQESNSIPSWNGLVYNQPATTNLVVGNSAIDSGPINNIQFSAPSGTINSGTISLYGINT